MRGKRIAIHGPAHDRSTRTAASRTPRRRRAPADNLAAQGRHRSDRALERDADAHADRLLRGERAHDSPASPLSASVGGGRPLGPAARPMGQAALGASAAQIRVHDDAHAQIASASLGARAFAEGSDIWLGRGESEHDRALMAHEIAHVAQRVPGPHLREATWLERRAWLNFFDHYMPRKLLDHYMDDTGTPITLSQQEMIDVNPNIDITQSPAFHAELSALRSQLWQSTGVGPAVKYIEIRGPGQAYTNGTLGNFTIKYRGALIAESNGDWTFTGAMEFYDIYDFDPKPWGVSGRSPAGELKTRVGAYFIPGRPFEVFSESTMCVQSKGDASATWIGGTPLKRGDKGTRGAADVEVGAGGGEVGGGEVGGGAGAELGAQSSEDLNR